MENGVHRNPRAERGIAASLEWSKKRPPSLTSRSRARCISLGSVGKATALGCTVVSTMTREKSEGLAALVRVAVAKHVRRHRGHWPETYRLSRQVHASSHQGELGWRGEECRRSNRGRGELGADYVVTGNVESGTGALRSASRSTTFSRVRASGRRRSPPFSKIRNPALLRKNLPGVRPR
jgi:hypothetical protein